MPDGDDKKLVRDMVLKSDDAIVATIKKLHDSNAFEFKHNARITMLEAIYLTAKP